MMSFRDLLLISVLTLGLSKTDGQTLANLKFQLPPLIDRYKMDFEIEGIPVATAGMLENLDLDQYESLRLVDEDVEVFDETTGYHLILYGVNKAITRYTSGTKNRGDG